MLVSRMRVYTEEYRIGSRLIVSHVAVMKTSYSLVLDP